MAHRRSLGLAVTSLALLGFGACTFGADDFAIVEKDEGSGATTSDAGSGNGSGGEGATSSQGGTDTGEGGSGASSSSGAASVGDAGAGGSGDGTPPFRCNPLGATFSVFTPEDLQNRSIDEGPFLIGGVDSVMVVVPTQPAGGGNDTRVFMRPIRDSGGGQVDSIMTHDTPNQRFRIGTVSFAPETEMLKLFGAVDKQVTEVSLPVSGGANQTTPLATPDDCTSVDGYVRDVKASYQGGELGYAVTCADRSATDEQYSLHLGDAASPSTTEVAQLEPLALNNIVRGYARAGDQHFIMVGAEVAHRLAVRYGGTATELQDLHPFGLSSDPLVWSSILVRPLPQKLFVFGAAFTTAEDPNDPPPLVPAELYAGSLEFADIPDLFAGAGSSNVPPAALQNIATFSKASQLVGIDDALPFGQNIVLAGASFSPRDRIHVSFLSQDGDVLAPPTEVYKSDGATITDHSVQVARLGIGMALVWIEDDNVLARMISCLQD